MTEQEARRIMKANIFPLAKAWCLISRLGNLNNPIEEERKHFCQMRKNFDDSKYTWLLAWQTEHPKATQNETARAAQASGASYSFYEPSWRADINERHRSV